MSRRRRLVTATSGMALVTVASRISGLARDKVVAALLGAGKVSDAFVTGFRIPNMFRAFLAEGSLHAAFIPTLAELRESGDPERPGEFVRAMTATLMLALPVIVAIGVLGAPLLVPMLAAAFVADPAQYALTVKLTRLMFPYLGLISLAALAQGVLNASDRFLLPAATPIALNLCIVAGTVTGYVVLDGRPEWLAFGVVAGGLAQFAMQWRACRRAGLPLIPGRGAFSHPEVRRVLRLMVPGIPSLGIYQLTILLSTQFAASIGTGAVFCIYNASRVNELVYGIAIVQLTTAVLPMLAADRARDEAAARETLGFAIRLLSVVALPATAFSAVFATPLVGALFGGGKYGPEAVLTASAALVMYSLGMPFLGLAKLLANASFAWKDTRTPLLAAGVSLAAFAILGLVLTRPFGAAGVAAATSGGQIANAAVLLAVNRRRGRMPRLTSVAPALARHAIAAAAMALTAWGFRSVVAIPLVTGVRSLLLVGVAGLLSLGVYLVVLVVVGAPEWRELRDVVVRRRTPA